MELNNERSRWRIQKNGLPEGSVLSPTLFHINTNDQPIQDGTRNFIYAHNLCITSQYPTFQEEVEQKIEEALGELTHYYRSNSLRANPDKTQVTAFHQRNREAKRSLQVSCNGVDLENTDTPKYLGVTLDRTLSYKTHIHNTKMKVLIHDTHADIITIQETKLTPKAKTPKIHNFTSVRTDRLHKAGGGLITLIRDNITFTTTDIPSTINTHNIELQMVKVHIDNTKHITIANIYIPPRDTTSTHYKTADTDIQHCIQYITNIPHSVLTGDVNAHSTLWHLYTDDHRGQLIADVISNSDHITLNTNTPTRVPNTTLQQTSSPDITTVSNTLYNWTSWTTQHALSSDHLPIITTINIRHDYRLQQNRRTFTNYKKADWTQFTEDTESAFAQTTIPTNIHTANRIFTNIILMADKQNIPKGKMHSNCRLLPEDIVCKITKEIT